MLIISCSLDTKSKSRELAKLAFDRLRSHDFDCEFLDLLDYPLPICDAGASFQAEHLPFLKEKIEAAKGVILAVPVYNYDVNAAAKNLIELTGRSWTDKVVGFICAAGGKSSYMSVMPFANSLMLDFRCLIVPRFVYADGDALRDMGNIDATVLQRVDELADMSRSLVERLHTSN